MRNLAFILFSSLVLFSCKEDDAPTPTYTSDPPLPDNYIGRLIIDHHTDTSSVKDTMENCVLTHVIFGADSAIKVVIHMPENNTSVTAMGDIISVISTTGERALMGVDSCLHMILTVANDTHSIKYQHTTTCEPGTDFFFEGER